MSIVLNGRTKLSAFQKMLFFRRPLASLMTEVVTLERHLHVPTEEILMAYQYIQVSELKGKHSGIPKKYQKLLSTSHIPFYQATD